MSSQTSSVPFGRGVSVSVSFNSITLTDCAQYAFFAATEPSVVRSIRNIFNITARVRNLWNAAPGARTG